MRMSLRGNLPGETNGDVVVRGRQIVFRNVVARAGLADASRLIDAKARKRVARPAAAVALNGQRLFRLKNAPAPGRLDMQQEVAVFLEQPEAVAHLPADLHRARRLRGRGFDDRECCEHGRADKTEGFRADPCH